MSGRPSPPLYYSFAPSVESDSKQLAAAKKVVQSRPDRLIVVGSSNGTKLTAAQKVFPDFVIIGFDVESGVGLRMCEWIRTSALYSV